MWDDGNFHMLLAGVMIEKPTLENWQCLLKLTKHTLPVAQQLHS